MLFDGWIAKRPCQCSLSHIPCLVCPLFGTHDALGRRVRCNPVCGDGGIVEGGVIEWWCCAVLCLLVLSPASLDEAASFLFLPSSISSPISSASSTLSSSFPDPPKALNFGSRPTIAEESSVSGPSTSLKTVQQQPSWVSIQPE